MNEHARGILLGTLAAMLLAPVTVAIWRALAPPSNSPTEVLSDEAWRRNTNIAREALVAGITAPFLLALIFGLGRALDLVGLAMVTGSIFAGSLLWVSVRNALRGRAGFRDFGTYIEAKEGISFRSWLYLSIGASVVSIVCLLITLSRI